MLCFRHRDRDRDRGGRDRDRDNRGRDRRRRRHGDDEDDSRPRRGGGGAQIAPPVSLTASSNAEQDNGVYCILTHFCFKSLSWYYWVLFLFLFRE